MWILRCIKNNECFYLTDKTKYTVGKINSDISIKDDTSISRSHAIIYRSSDQEDGLQLEDVGSKYGTFVNHGADKEEPIIKKKRIPLKAGVRVRFGLLQCIWEVRHHPLVSLTSSLSQPEIQELQQHINALGGRNVSRYESSCTHLTMSELQITVKLLYALLDQIPIVTLQYWRDLCAAVNSKSSELPAPHKYAPPTTELLHSHSLDLSSRSERIAIFRAITFVFMNRRQYELYEPIITKAGGICEHLNKSMSKTKLLKAKVLIIQYIPSTESQSTQTINTIEEYLRSHGRRVIPEYEIGLAIVHCSTEEYCNPDYKIVSDTVPSSSCGEEQIVMHDVLTPNVDANTGTNYTDEEIAETQVNPDIPRQKPAVQRVTPMPVIDLDAEKNNANVPSVARKNSSPVKRKHNLLLDDDEDDLFAFSDNPQPTSSMVEHSNKRQCTQHTEQRLSEIDNTQRESQGPNRTVSTSGFINKSNVRATQAEEPVAVQVNRKRTHIAVLTDDDDDDDNNDLFNFNDDDDNSPKKRPRFNESLKSTRHDDGDEGDLFNFTSNNRPQRGKDCTNASDVSKTPKATVSARKSKTAQDDLPKAKELPARIDISKWLHTSLHKLSVKDEANDETTSPKVKEEDDNIESPADQTWLNTLKKGLSIRLVNVSLNVARQSSVSEAPTIATGTGKNFKKFVKSYQRPNSIVTR